MKELYRVFVDIPRVCNAVARVFVAGLWVASVISSAATFAAPPAPTDQAYSYRRLHSFCTRNCNDGSDPETALVIDSAGNLYGTTLNGGPRSDGVVYEIKPGQKGIVFEVIYGFCEHVKSCDTGNIPAGNLTIDSNGNLYGTAAYGGDANGGTVFRLSARLGHEQWQITKLYDFCVHGACTDGNMPYTGLTYIGAASGSPYDGKSPLYGTTDKGGANNYGVVFELAPPKKGATWNERVLYSFCTLPNCSDGYSASDTPVVDQAGNIYGSTYYGGKNDKGTVYEVSSRTPKGSWSEKVLHNFEYHPNSFGSMVLDSAGDLYGVAQGGKHGDGVLFELVPYGSDWAYRALYSFCSLQNCADGSGPMDIIMDSSGDFFGVSALGGKGNGGTVLKLLTAGSKLKPSVLYSFCTQSRCADGRIPFTVTLSSSGNLFGTTENGGKNGPDGNGVAFELMAR